MIPKEIYICGGRYEIRILKEVHRGLVYGSAHFSEGYIELAERSSEDFMRETLWHEVIHIIDRMLFPTDFESGVTMALMRKQCNEEKGYRLEEPEVVAFSRGQWQTMTDPRNAGAMRWIIGN